MSVLFYHRVADDHPNSWSISRSDFQKHIEYCQNNFELIALDDLQRRVRSGESPRATVSITFDDGYADNCDFAFPLMIERNVPCTYFVTTTHILKGESFPHDVEAGVPLQPNTVAQLREAADAGIEIGLHTRDHVDFSRIHDPDVVHAEIVEAKDVLEQMIGRAVRYFAFPYGMPWQLTQQAIEAVHEAGLLGFCSAYGAYNLASTTETQRDPFHIRRCHGDAELSRLRNWLTFDPAKVRTEPDVRYSLPLGNDASGSLTGKTRVPELGVTVP